MNAGLISSGDSLDVPLEVICEPIPLPVRMRVGERCVASSHRTSPSTARARAGGNSHLGAQSRAGPKSFLTDELRKLAAGSRAKVVFHHHDFGLRTGGAVGRPCARRAFVRWMRWANRFSAQGHRSCMRPSIVATPLFLPGPELRALDAKFDRTSPKPVPQTSGRLPAGGLRRGSAAVGGLAFPPDSCGEKISPRQYWLPAGCGRRRGS